MDVGLSVKNEALSDHVRFLRHQRNMSVRCESRRAHSKNTAPSPRELCRVAFSTSSPTAELICAAGGSVGFLVGNLVHFRAVRRDHTRTILVTGINPGSFGFVQSRQDHVLRRRRRCTSGTVSCGMKATLWPSPRAPLRSSRVPRSKQPMSQATSQTSQGTPRVEPCVFRWLDPGVFSYNGGGLRSLWPPRLRFWADPFLYNVFLNSFFDYFSFFKLVQFFL